MSSKKRKSRTPTQWPQNVHYSVTVNKWTPEHLALRMQGVKNSEYYYIKGQCEAAPDTGHLHLQCYLYSKVPKSYPATLAWCNDFFGADGCNVKPINSKSHFDNIFPYVHKDESCYHIDTRFELGCELPEYLLSVSGSSTEEQTEPLLKGISTTLKSGEKWKDDRWVIVWIGPPKLGKNYMFDLICEYLGERPYKMQAPNASQAGRWMGDYAGQAVALIDEVAYEHFNDVQWKVITDRTPGQVAAGGGGKEVTWSPRVVFLFGNCTARDETTAIMDEKWVYTTGKRKGEMKLLDADPLPDVPPPLTPDEVKQGLKPTKPFCPSIKKYFFLKSPIFKYRLKDAHYMGGVPPSTLHMKAANYNF